MGAVPSDGSTVAAAAAITLNANTSGAWTNLTETFDPQTFAASTSAENVTPGTGDTLTTSSGGQQVVWTPATLPADAAVLHVDPAPVTTPVSGFTAGGTSVNVTLVTSSGAQIHALPAPIEIIFDSGDASDVPSTSDDGVSLRTLALLPDRTLHADQADRYWREQTGPVSPFATDDLGVYQVVAYDAAGNLSPMSPGITQVPNVMGLPLAGATAELVARGFGVGLVTQQAAGGSSRAIVVDQSPAPHAMATVGSPIDLEVVGAAGQATLLASVSGAKRIFFGGRAYIQVRLRLTLPGGALTSTPACTTSGSRFQGRCTCAGAPATSSGSRCGTANKSSSAARGSTSNPGSTFT